MIVEPVPLRELAGSTGDRRGHLQMFRRMRFNGIELVDRVKAKAGATLTEPGQDVNVLLAGSRWRVPRRPR